MVVAPSTPLQVAPVTDDAALLDGAASAWAVITFASELPATPEQKEALEHARTRLLQEASRFGFSEGIIRERVQALAHGPRPTACAPPRLVE